MSIDDKITSDVTTTNNFFKAKLIKLYNINFKGYKDIFGTL